MVDKKITPKAAGSKEKGSADRAAARVSLRQTKRQTTSDQASRPSVRPRSRSDPSAIVHLRAGANGAPPFLLVCEALRPRLLVMRRQDDLEVGAGDGGSTVPRERPERRPRSVRGRRAVHRFRRGNVPLSPGRSGRRRVLPGRGPGRDRPETANGNRMLHATLDTPGFVGELSALGQMPRTASVLTLDDSDVWSTGPETFLDFVSAEPPPPEGSSRRSRDRSASISRSRTTCSRPQGPGGEAPAAARDAEPGRSAFGRGRGAGRHAPTSRACAAGAART